MEIMKLKRVKRPRINLRFFEGDDTTYLMLTIKEFDEMAKALEDMRDNVDILKKRFKEYKNGI